VGAVSTAVLFSVIGSGGVAAAGARDLHSGLAAHVTLVQPQADDGRPDGDRDGSGPGGTGGSGQGQGTTTPELPSGILFGIGLVPLAVGTLWRRRRARSARS